MSRFLSGPKMLIMGLVFAVLAQPLLAQDEAKDEPKFSFGMFANLGSETVDGTNFQYLGLLPDFGYGPWGVGVDLSFHFQFYKEPGGKFGFYPRAEDWWDNDLSTLENVDKYLARLAYVRYGHKGDPLYAQLGWIQSTTLGTGFTVQNYNNGVFRPGVKFTGLNFDMNGSLFDVPWVGMESFVGNITSPNLVGFRGYVLPFVPLGTESPILKGLQVGVTAVVDSDPYTNIDSTGFPDASTVTVFGVDSIAPLYNSDAATVRSTLDLVAEGSHTGGALGVDGSLIKIITWGLQFRAFSDNFIANYVDQGYELSRASKYLVYNGDVDVPGALGYQASIGTSLLGDAFQLGVSFSGPFGSVDDVLAQPQLMGYATLQQKDLPVSFNAYYLKHGVTGFDKLTSPKDALIGAKVGWTFGVATLSVIYDLRYNTEAAGPDWISTSRVETSVKMF